PAGLDQLPRDLEPRRLATRERGRRLAETQVAEPDLLQLPERLAKTVLLDEEADRLIHREVEHFADVLALVRDLERLGLVAPPTAHLARDQHVREEDHL